MLNSSHILIQRLNEIDDFVRQARVDMALERMQSIINDYTPIEESDPFSLYRNPFFKKWNKKIAALEFQHSDIQKQFMDNFITPQDRDARMNRLVASLLTEQEYLIEDLSSQMRKYAA